MDSPTVSERFLRQLNEWISGEHAMDKTLEAIYLLNDIFYGFDDFDNWPESAKLFRRKIMSLLGGIIHESKLTPEQLIRILSGEVDGIAKPT